jgi:hypothetical protein
MSNCHPEKVVREPQKPGFIASDRGRKARIQCERTRCDRRVEGAVTSYRVVSNEFPGKQQGASLIVDGDLQRERYSHDEAA